MKNNMIFLFSLFFIVNCSEPVINNNGVNMKNDWQEMNLNGNVKSLESSFYNTVSKDLFKACIQRGIWGTSILFDDKGNIIEMMKKKIDGSLREIYTYEYELNAINNSLEKKIYNSKGNLEQKMINRFDAKGNIIETLLYGSKNIHVYNKKNIFDNDGKIIEENYYDLYGRLSHKLTNIFDDKGNKIETTFYGPDDSPYSKHSHIFNNKETKRKEKRFNCYKDSLSSVLTLVLVFDDKGNIVEEYNYNYKNGNLYSKYNFKYEFDKKNNWIKKIKLANDTSISITERKIKYFDLISHTSDFSK